MGISVGVGYKFLRQADRVGKSRHLQNPMPQASLASVNEPIQPVKSASASSGPGLADIDAWLATCSTSWPADKLVRAILALDADAREKVLAKLADNFRSMPAIWASFIERLTTIWAEQSPGPAISFLDTLHDQSGDKHSGILLLESKLMSEWVGRDFPSVGQYLQHAWQQQAHLSAAQLDLLVSIGQNEQKAKLGDMLNWVAGLQGEADRPLKVAVSEAFARMGQAENFQPIADMLGKDITDPSLAKCVSQFAARNATGSPEKVAQWLEKLAPHAGASGPVIISDFFDQLGRSDPTTAVKLINSGFTDIFMGKSPANVTEISGGPSSITPDQLYDLALSKVVKNVMGLDPNYALICSGYFNDSHLQAQYTKTIQHLMLSGARQNHE